MTDKRKALWAEPQLTANVIVDNETASQDLITEPTIVNTGGNYLYMERLIVSVYSPSHGGGMLELKDSTGDVKWRTNVDGVKDLNLDFGEQGLYIGQNTGLKAVVSGSQGENAGVSVIFLGHTSNRRVSHTTLSSTQVLQTT